MKTIIQLIKSIQTESIQGDTNMIINEVCFDSRKVQTGDLFIAVRGTVSDGHLYIDNAISHGATCIVCEVSPSIKADNVCVIIVSDSSLALGIIATNYYDSPSSQLKLIGVTGTNGKTSIATLLFKLSRAFGFSTGLISTVRNQMDELEIPSTHTTPDALSLNELLRKMVDNGCSYVFMEVSSHACDQNRISGLHFDVAIFSNITHDHLDYHKTFRNYFNAKKKFFDMLDKSSFAISNADDKNGHVILQNTKATKRFYSLRNAADVRAKILSNTLSGLQLQIDHQDISFKLSGEFNAYNLLAVYTASKIFGWDETESLRILSRLDSAEGRFETHISKINRIVGIVDYAHTPDALEKVLQTLLKSIEPGVKVITVVGCGGDRDKSKRPIMASIGAELSDSLILTSDNPRTEEPINILNEMMEGVKYDPLLFKKVTLIEDRKQAIELACRMASPGDVILIAGKGHEKYQEIKGVKYPFDDVEILLNTYNQFQI